MSNDKNNQIYYRPLKKWITVTEEQKKSIESFFNSIRISKKRLGECCIPFKMRYKCDGVCDTCKYRCYSKSNPCELSIDSELENTRENGMNQGSFLTDEALITEMNIDTIVINDFLKDLKESDYESYQILKFVCEGMHERDAANYLHMSRSTYVYKRNKILDVLKKNLRI